MLDKSSSLAAALGMTKFRNNLCCKQGYIKKKIQALRREDGIF
jgi:hypothetical protein